MLAPTTKSDRRAKVIENCSGFIYYVSLKGVTGSGALDVAAVREQVAKIKQQTTIPVCVWALGFVMVIQPRHWVRLLMASLLGLNWSSILLIVVMMNKNSASQGWVIKQNG